MSQTMTRRSFTKMTALAGIAAASGISASNLVETEKAWAEDEVEEIRTCCRACINNCGIIATVRNGRVVKLKGDPIDVLTEGRICPKGLAGISALYHPNRFKYPLVRVGAKPGNDWERVSWDDAAEKVARALIEMRDKTGRRGLLCTTGGGGNPQFFSINRFRNFWGAGDLFEPGQAQCWLPRFWATDKVSGCAAPSMADMNTVELFKPAKYEDQAEVVVLWGTNPAWHSPAASGMVMTKLRNMGCKTVVVDPRLTPDASKADVWLPIKPGTDIAMMLGWMNYIIENKLYERIPGYEDFAEKFTNLPFLVDARDEVKLPPVAQDITADGRLLRASDVFDDCDSENEGYVYWDKANGLTKAFALGPDNEASYQPELFGSFDVTLKDGTVVQCKTAFQAYKDRCKEWTLEKTAQVTGCEADQIEKAIEIYCSTGHGGIVIGVATDQQPNSVQAALGVAALDSMTAHLGHYGCPSIDLGVDPLGSIINPPALFGPTNYPFYPENEIVQRLGYTEHKALGKWQHSHTPTCLSAAITGEPHQPKVWLERSGNKMVALANASSWLEAIPNFDCIVQGFMYPTSFTTEAADIVFPTCEWLETFFLQPRMNYMLIRQPIVRLFEAADEIMMWSKIAEAMSHPGTELYDENMEASFDQEKIGEGVLPWFRSVEEYYDKASGLVGFSSFEEAKKNLPAATTPDDEFYLDGPYDERNYLAVGEDGLYKGFATAPRDIKDSPKKSGPYADQLLHIGRHGEEAFEMPPSSVDYNPMPYYYEPEDGVQFGDRYPLILTQGRLPQNHHGTLRNNPYLREMYPAPELWVHPADAQKYGVENGDWVNIKSPRTDGLDVFRDISTGIDPDTGQAMKGKATEFSPGEELTGEAQKAVSEGIYAQANVTLGIPEGCVYMERFWNPEFLEDGSDGRKSWTLMSVNVLTKNTGYYNPEIGSYSLRAVNVKIEKAQKPEGIWYEPSDFESWLPVPSDSTGGGCSQS